MQDVLGLHDKGRHSNIRVGCCLKISRKPLKTVLSKHTYISTISIPVRLHLIHTD